MQVKKYYLIFAWAAVSTIGVMYGLSPDWFARTFLDRPDLLHRAELGVDLAHILRAVMGLYIALGLFWLYAAFHASYRATAILTTLIFCAGLVSGRLLSFAVEGRPSPLLVLYAVMELGLIPVGLWVLKQPDT